MAAETIGAVKTTLEQYFEKYRQNTIGYNAHFDGPYGRKRILYADWIASGRLYQPIEDKISRELGPYVANTHTETSFTGATMTKAYSRAKKIIKRHVNANENDSLILTGTGMTGAVLKLQRILGLKLPEQFNNRVQIGQTERPVVFVSHMEHHSNQTSWMETVAEVVQIQANDNGELYLNNLENLLKEYELRPIKIASVTSCSNVTGVFTPYHEVAKLMHRSGGLCFVDFACSGPYVDIDMHPEEPEAYLDAIFFSPHKFLGGPGTPGILIFNNKLYKNKVPDHPGGGTVTWTNPWGGHRYFDDIEIREDGGTPGFLQTIKAAMAMQLKEEIGTENILAREHELINYAFKRLRSIPNLHILADNIENRLGAISFYIDDCHYNLAVSLLNDRFGIQTRGGCSCAGTYGHYLLHVDESYSRQITDRIDRGDVSLKPGWVRLSLHPMFTNAELSYICDAIETICNDWQEHATYYFQPKGSTEYLHKESNNCSSTLVDSWFNL